ncbi:MAG TPA: hypothetical protein VFU98_08070, partial [Microlunatus sp.]|nr:hypothetical protein [Microlunatus sp.]
RRPTADADALARNMAADEQTVVQRVVDIALIAMPEDGVRFDADSVRAQQIREEAVYAGTRVRMDAHLATADVRLSLDINFGDPVTPGPQPILRCPGSAAGSDLARRIEPCQHHASTTRRPVTVR